VRGSVVWFDAAKRYGFVAPADGAGDIVVRLNPAEAAALGPLERGDPVNFAVVETERGPEARQLGRGHDGPHADD
jgi:CspA family cold shock protein